MMERRVHNARRDAIRDLRAQRDLPCPAAHLDPTAVVNTALLGVMIMDARMPLYHARKAQESIDNEPGPSALAR